MEMDQNNSALSVLALPSGVQSLPIVGDGPGVPYREPADTPLTRRGSNEADVMFAPQLGGDIRGGGGDDYLFGGDNSDMLIGGWLVSDLVETGTGNDYIDGGGGAFDNVDGRDGDDVVLGGAGTDSVRGGDGNDFVFGDGVSEAEGDSHDSVYGGAGDDFIMGGGGNDALFGDEGFDILVGGTGSDLLHGGEGVTFAFGGEGRDTFRTRAGDGVTFIWDFSHNDGDLIEILDYGLSSIEQLRARGWVMEYGLGTLIWLGDQAKTAIYVHAQSPDTLNASNFDFWW
jgi:Ca2+-binding RTX toxin-like protein